jgi:hypothetical protein
MRQPRECSELPIWKFETHPSLPWRRRTEVGGNKNKDSRLDCLEYLVFNIISLHYTGFPACGQVLIGTYQFAPIQKHL